MVEPKKDLPGEESAGFRPKAPREYLNYFGRDRWIHAWLREKRTKLVSTVVPALDRLGLVPDTISYTGIACLAGVILFFVRRPLVAVLFLAGHIICDGVDGAYARYTGRPSQSGAFTDIVCDQLGMVVVAMMAILHHMVPPLLGAVYITLYLIVVVFGVLINVLGLGTRLTITSKYLLYALYAVWAGWGKNYVPLLMYVFSVIMAVEAVIGYFRLKRGIRRKFDAEVRFTEGDQYSGRLNYALNVAVPMSVFMAIIVGGNTIPIRAMFDRPKLMVSWTPGPRILEPDGNPAVLGFGVRDGRFLLLVRLEDETAELRRIRVDQTGAEASFTVPSFLDPASSTLPVDGNLLLVADRSTRLLIGVDIDASFAAKRAVMVLTVPLRYLSVTSGATAQWRGTTVWLAANYLYTRRTYLVDPNQALRQGYILGGEVASYINGGFPSGLTVSGDLVFDFNKTPLHALIYVASLNRLISGSNLLDASIVSFAPPDRNAIGPVREGDDLVMLSPEGRIFRLPMKSVLGERGTGSRRPVGEYEERLHRDGPDHSARLN